MKNKWIISIITLILIISVIAVTILSNNKLSENDNKSVINRNAKIEDIVYEEGKVNIYFFWGDGCPHCEKVFDFFEKINNEYSKYYNIYAFEVWFNQDNAKLMLKLADVMNERINGVPYTIIGEKTFTGFENSIKKDMKKAIEDQSVKNFDAYKNLE